MIIPFVIVIGIAFLIPKPPELVDPPDVARWAECDIGKVSWFVGQRMDYKLTRGWESATSCLERKTGDCKCFAVAAKEIMDNCNGFHNRVITLRRSVGDGYKYHAVTLITMPDGSRAYINGGYYQVFDRDKDIEKMLEEIPGGPWEYVHG